MSVLRLQEGDTRRYLARTKNFHRSWGVPAANAAKCDVIFRAWAALVEASPPSVLEDLRAQPVNVYIDSYFCNRIL